MSYYTILSLCWGREHSPVFRQSSELCLIWLHDIPHILHQAQGQLFALTLTFLSSNALALTPPWLSCLVLCANSLTKFTSSLPVYASYHLPLCICLWLLSTLVSSCLILPILCPCYPYLSSLYTPFFFFPSSSPSLSLSVSPSFPSSPPCGGQVWCRARELARV